jgi:hypothetical protein
MNADWVFPESSTRRLPLFGSFAQRHAVWWRTALVFAVLVVACALFSIFDDRTFNGVSVWSKPLKFSLSIAVFFSTLAWFTPLLPNGYLQARKGRWLTALPVWFAALEIAYIVLQASRGQASHFNFTSPLYAVLYSLMGLGAITMVSICLWMGIVILRNRGTESPYAFAVGVGLIVTFVLGGGFGGYMGNHMSHWVGGTPSDTNGLWPMNWSRDGGDLRVAHFFGMHAMQVLPVIGALLARVSSQRLAIGGVIGAACIYAAGTIFTFVQALQGTPFM